MKYKIIISDYDDTLCKDKVSERTLHTIREFEKRGGKFVISTGRSLPSILEIAEKLDMKGYLMSYNGSVLYDMGNKKVLHSISLSYEDGIKIAKQMEEEGINPQIYIGNEVYTKFPCYYSIRYEHRTGVKIHYTGINASEYLERTKSRTTKILAYLDPSKTEEKAKKYNEMFGDTNSFFCSSPHLFECIDKKAGKGNMAKAFCEMEGITPDELIAFGDSENDISLLEVAGLKVAMGNGVPKIKEVANLITDNVENDGVAMVIEKYCLEG